ncbi:hypothetical protein HYFRA_00011872 [Hymenoscyphus fraxineus]|uniref:Uncharacterized protein n=1 Tax=Hymenoscyphus fraxineus TaxID=746836 RepID=A0A9N9L0J8_9HELO|nr:hypothetical protein HYFRA_00011872 [Hymenoscyphus fraxineus]
MASKMLSPTFHLLTRPEGIKHAFIRSAFLDLYLKDIHPSTTKVDSKLGQKGEGHDDKTTTSRVSGAQKPEPTSNKTPAKDGSGNARPINIATTKSKTYNYMMSRQDNMNKIDPFNGAGKKNISTIHPQEPVTKDSNPILASATAIEKSISNKLVHSWSISLSEPHTDTGKSGINTAKSPQCPDLDALLVSSRGTTQSSPKLCLLCQYPHLDCIFCQPPSVDLTSTSAKRPQLGTSVSTSDAKGKCIYKTPHGDPPNSNNTESNSLPRKPYRGLGLGLASAVLASGLAVGYLEGDTNGLMKEIDQGKIRKLGWDELGAFGLF